MSPECGFLLYTLQIPKPLTMQDSVTSLCCLTWRRSILDADCIACHTENLSKKELIAEPG